MDGSQNCHYLSLKSPIRSSSPKATYSGNGENEYESDGERGILSRPRKPPATNKNFMSPTFSAASKAVKTPRKKILSERNEDSSLYASEFNSSFSGTHLQKTPILDPKSNVEQIVYPNSNIISPRPVHSADNNDEAPFRTHDSTTPLPSYDPVKNYLSPRPKFLRYRPNRHRETILGRELEGRDEGLLSLNASTVTSDSKKSSDEEEEEPLISGDGSLEQEPELKHEDGESEILEDTDDEEEIEEDNIWSLNWASKILLVFLVLPLCTAYISSMNSPPPRLPLQLKISLPNKSQTAEVRILNKTTMWHIGGANSIYEPWEETWDIGISETELRDDDPDQVFQVLEGVERGGKNESNYDHSVEDPGDWFNLSYVSLWSVLDPREPPLLPLTDPMNDLSSTSSWYSSYPPLEEEEAPAGSVISDQGTFRASPSSVVEKSPAEDANRITEGIVVKKKAIDQGGITGSTIVDHNATANVKEKEPAAAAPAKPELVKMETDSEAKVTYDYMYGFASNSLAYVLISSFAVLAFVVVKLFLKSRRLRSSSSIVAAGSEGEGGGRGGIPRRGSSRNAATIEQAEEGLPRTNPVAPIPPLRDGSPSVELLSEFKVGGGVNKRSSLIKTEMADSKAESGPSRVQQEEPTMMMDIHSYGSFVGQELIGRRTVSINIHDGGKDEARTTTTPVSVRRSTRIRNRGAKSP